MDHEKRALDVDREYLFVGLVELIGRQVGQRNVPIMHTGVGHQHIELAEAIHARLDGPSAIARISDIAPDGDRAVAERLDNPLEPLSVAIHRDHPGAFADEPADHAGADSRSGSGDQGHAVS